MNTLPKWMPHCDHALLHQRALLYSRLREFMAERAILEVDTPALSHATSSDPYIHSITAMSRDSGQLYLQTSPEFCMKRLLAAGSGDIYQITHAFRDDPEQRYHIKEFSLLEWYRLGFDYQMLMDELTALLISLGLTAPTKRSYADVFLQGFNINPHSASIQSLRELCVQYGWQTDCTERHELLDFLFSMVLIPQNLATESFLIYDYPQCMASLAKLKPEKPPVAERFELFIQGIEIANGFSELTEADIQRQRFAQDAEKRQFLGEEIPMIDAYFLEALESGMPDSAGVAVGLDRLLMILTDTDTIAKVCSFTLSNN